MFIQIYVEKIFLLLVYRLVNKSVVFGGQFEISSHFLLHQHTPLLFNPHFLLQLSLIVFRLEFKVLSDPFYPLLLQNEFCPCSSLRKLLILFKLELI